MSDYAKQKFFEAVHALVGPAPIDNRLSYAANYLLILQDKQVPEHMRDEFTLLRNKLTSTPVSNERGFQARAISEDDARKLAEQIVSMYTELMGGL